MSFADKLRNPFKPRQNPEPKTEHEPNPEGYYVDRAIAYTRGHAVNFVNSALGIDRPLVRELHLLNFPGFERGEWVRHMERPDFNPEYPLRVEVSAYDGQGHSRVLIYIQWHDTPDESGFGMEDTPEIVLCSTLNERGEFLHPFRLYELSW